MKITIYLSMIKNTHFANTGCFGYLHPQKGPAAYLWQLVSHKYADTAIARIPST